MKRINFFIFFVVIGIVCVARSVYGAELKFVESEKEIYASQSVRVDLVLDTANERINAVSGEVAFSNDMVSLVAIEDAKSIVNFWVDKPELSQNGKIVFSGVTPGGYQGAGANILSLVFVPKKAGIFILKLNYPSVLLHDGKGTQALIEIKDIQLEVRPSQNGTQETYAVTDNIPPQQFSIQLAQNKYIADGKWFAVFASQDKETGVAYYQAQEQKENHVDDQVWQNVESPYVLHDQKLQSYIYVKAVDQKGNSVVSVLSPQVKVSYAKTMQYGIIIIICIILLLSMQYLWRKKIKK